VYFQSKLQSKHLDIAKAIQFAEITCSNLTSFKTDIDGAVSFNSLYDDCFEICESRGIDTPNHQYLCGTFSNHR
jgi:hypothetical protein